jgi:prepilin-type N-terminal cleavage/methylation domain-containing protein
LRAKCARAAGFSLIEVLCAIIILGVGVVGLSEGITVSLRSSKEAERVSAAADLAAGRIETLRAEGYLTAGETEGDFGGEYPLYGYRQTIGTTSIDGLFEVTVAVNLRGGEEVFELKTLLFEMPLSAIRTSPEDREGKGEGSAAGRPGSPSRNRTGTTPDRTGTTPAPTGRVPPGAAEGRGRP